MQSDMDVYWYLVPRDGFYPWTPQGARKIDFGYLRQVATAVDYLGFTGALLATGGGAHDAWVMGAALIPLTTQMKFGIRLNVIVRETSARSIRANAS